MSCCKQLKTRGKNLKKQLNQQGFHVIVILLIIVIIGAIAGAGYYVWQNNKKSNKAATTQSIPKTTAPSTVSTTTPTTTNETASWKTYKNNQHNFSFKYPSSNTWVVEENDTYTTNKIASFTAQYRGCEINCGMAFSVMVEPYDGLAAALENFGDSQMQGNNFYKLASKTTIKVGETSGLRWGYQPPDNSAAGIIYYSFKYGNKGYKLTVNSNGAIPVVGDKIDLTNYGERIFSTFKFN